jgi:hypothetical protein
LAEVREKPVHVEPAGLSQKAIKEVGKGHEMELFESLVGSEGQSDSGRYLQSQSMVDERLETTRTSSLEEAGE